MGFFSSIFRGRDAPTNRTSGSSYSFFMGGSSSGKRVNERTAMQMTAVYSCVRILSEAVAGLPLQFYKYNSDGGKEKAVDHPLYFLLHDEPNPEMTSFIFRETLMTHLLLWGNAYSQIIRNARGEIIALYPLMPDRMEVNRDANGQMCFTTAQLPTFDIGLNEKMNDTSIALLEEKVLTCSTFKFLGSYTPYGNFIDGFDGYWYGFSNQQNSSGNATVYWIKIKKDDYSFTEGSWSLSNAALLAVGSMVETDSYPKRVIRSVVRNGYLYVPKYDKTGIYKINISNSTDVTLIEFGFTSAMKPLGGSGSCENYLIMVGDLIIGWDFQVDANDNVTQTMGEERFENLATPLLPYKQFLTCWEGSYGNEYHSTYLLTPYLATINNLSSAVVKNADKTMKITYTLTEEES